MLVRLQDPFWLQTPDGSLNWDFVHRVKYIPEMDGKEVIQFWLNQSITIDGNPGIIYEADSLAYSSDDGELFQEMKNQLKSAGFIRITDEKPKKLIAVPAVGEN